LCFHPLDTALKRKAAMRRDYVGEDWASVTEAALLKEIRFMENIDQIAIIMLRIANGALYMNAAWACYRYFDSYTVGTTRMLLPTASERLVRLLSWAGCVVLAVGGLTMVTGYFVRIGGLLLVGFLVGGVIIHYRLRNQAPQLRAGVVPGLREDIRRWDLLAEVSKRTSPKPEPLASLDELAASCYGAHNGEWLKNLVLLVLSLFFVLYGWKSWRSLIE
jgi:uncharacterized membrane protein YphA (DoxX/SURF4 family)